MLLYLSPLPTTLRGPAGDGYNGRVPRRALFLAPDAAGSLMRLEEDTGGLVYTDIYRSAQESLDARGRKSGVQPPAFSAHGYGLAFDVDLSTTLRKLHTSYVVFREYLETFGWYCHRRDLESGASEAWHFNYLGEHGAGEALLKLADPTQHSTWAAPVESAIATRYGSELVLTPSQIEVALVALDMASIEAFQTTWGLQVDGVAGPRTQRTLAYVTAKVTMEPMV